MAENTACVLKGATVAFAENGGMQFAYVAAWHGRSGLGKAILGSVTRAVLTHSERPVHVVSAS